jgi:hypothetical protein
MRVEQGLAGFSPLCRRLVCCNTLGGFFVWILPEFFKKQKRPKINDKQFVCNGKRCYNNKNSAKCPVPSAS